MSRPADVSVARRLVGGWRVGVCVCSSLITFSFHFISQDATRLLALYRRTEEDTMYIFDDKLRRLKQRLPLADLMSLETRLPRLRSIRQQERAEAKHGDGG